MTAAMLRRLSPLLILLAAGACGASPAPAGPITPERLTAALDDADAGDRLILAPADFGGITIAKRHFTKPVTIVARGATFDQIILRDVAGLTLEGGTIRADRMQTFSLLIDASHDVTVRGFAISGGRVAVSMTRSHDIVVRDNDFGGTRSDGVNVAMSQRVLIAGNRCHDFDPVPPVYDDVGKLVTDGDHPDCVQAWSRPGDAPTADVTIVDNVASGRMQGIFFGDPGNGGYDRITVRRNELSLAMFHGVTLMEARDSMVADNVVRAAPDAKMLNYPFKPVTPWIRVTGEGNTICGNTVEFQRFSDGSPAPCRDPSR